jgi:hypothetical protein
MKKGLYAYEYVAVYVDDLAIAMHEPDKFISNWKKNTSFKQKVVGQ